MEALKWKFKEYGSEAYELLRREPDIPDIIAKLLCIRGINTPAEAFDFFNADKKSLHDPFLMKDMDKAVERIEKAIGRGDRICIYGDYDVDGVTSTVLLYKYFVSKGLRCFYFIPERITEGYGLNCPAIEKIAGNAELIITVDTGITAVREAELAKSLNIDMIITDHHNCRDRIPDAAAVVNPQRNDCAYPFKQLAGVGVVFKLLCALEKDDEEIIDRFLDIAAIGTVADVMPLVGENRFIVSEGLKRLEKTRCHGLRELMLQTGIIKTGKKNGKIGSSSIGYILAPRLNAAGRIASASLAAELFLSEEAEKAKNISTELCRINKVRQQTEQQIYIKAAEMIEAEYKDDKFLVLCSRDWHPGVIGVVASKLSEKYSLPCILFSLSGGFGKGSGRGIKGFSLTEALNACSGLLVEYGGHDLAAGLTIEEDKIKLFREKINSYASENLGEPQKNNYTEIDCELDYNEITVKNIEKIQRLEPFGMQNPAPLFLMRNIRINEIFSISDGRHIKLKLRPQRGGELYGELNAVYFGMAAEKFGFFAGDICDIIFSLEINDYMSAQSPQLFIRNVFAGEEDTRSKNSGYELYAKICDVANRDELPDGILPTLADFRAIFDYLKKRKFTGRDENISVVSVCRQTGIRERLEEGICAVKIIFDVLRQEKLIEFNYTGNDIFSFNIIPFKNKIDLGDSVLLNNIRDKHIFYRKDGD